MIIICDNLKNIITDGYRIGVGDGEGICYGEAKVFGWGDSSDGESYGLGDGNGFGNGYGYGWGDGRGRFENDIW